MLTRLRSFLRSRKGSLQRSDYTDAGQQVENVDAATAARFGDLSPGPDGGFIPPNYVPPVDEGRPRK